MSRDVHWTGHENVQNHKPSVCPYSPYSTNPPSCRPTTTHSPAQHLPSSKYTSNPCPIPCRRFTAPALLPAHSSHQPPSSMRTPALPAHTHNGLGCTDAVHNRIRPGHGGKLDHTTEHMPHGVGGRQPARQSNTRRISELRWKNWSVLCYAMMCMDALSSTSKGNAQ